MFKNVFFLIFLKKFISLTTTTQSRRDQITFNICFFKKYSEFNVLLLFYLLPTLKNITQKSFTFFYNLAYQFFLQYASSIVLSFNPALPSIIQLHKTYIACLCIDATIRINDKEILNKNFIFWGKKLLG